MAAMTVIIKNFSCKVLTDAIIVIHGTSLHNTEMRNIYKHFNVKNSARLSLCSAWLSLGIDIEIA